MKDGGYVFAGDEDSNPGGSGPNGVGWHADDTVDICKEDTYPAGWDTFKQMYSDEHHPSEEGTYLKGLIIASAMTGARLSPCTSFVF